MFILRFSYNVTNFKIKIVYYIYDNYDIKNKFNNNINREINIV